MRFANPYLLAVSGADDSLLHLSHAAGRCGHFYLDHPGRRAPRTLRYWLRHAVRVAVRGYALLVVALARPQDVDEQRRSSAEVST